MKKLSFEEGLKRLDLSIKLFQMQNHQISISQIKVIEKELQGRKDYITLNLAFKVLQTSFIVSYNTTPHRILCSTFFKKRINKTLKLNVSGLNNRSLDKKWAKLIEQRVQGRNVLMKLEKILERGSKSEEEKAISVCYLYLSLIDGIYGKNLKDIVIWDMLSNLTPVNFDKIKKMNMTDIKDYFQGIPNSSCLFAGWNIDIRNTIAHSSFWYDIKKKKIFFEERRKNRKHQKSINEMVDMIDELSDIDQLVFYYNEIQIVNKIIMDLR